MFWRLVTRALLRQRAKRALVALTVALGVSLSTAILSVMLDVGDKVNAELKAYGANIVVRPQTAAVMDELYGEVEAGADATLAEDELVKMKTIFWAFNILDFAPFLQTDVSVRLEGAAEGVIAPAVGTWFARDLDLPTGEEAVAGMRSMRSWWDVTGEWATDTAPDAVMAGTQLATQLGIAPGDTLLVSQGDRTLRLRVTGVVDTGGEEDGALVVPLAVVQQLTGQPGRVGWVEVSALTTPDNELSRRAAQDPSSLSATDWETWYCTAYVSAIAYQIEEVVTGAAAKPVRQVAESEGLVLEKTQLLMLLITALSLIGTALGIANLITASVMERAPEIGLLKAVGAADRSVVALVMTEIVLVGLGGGVAGYLAGLGLAQLIGISVFGAAVALKPIVIPITAVLVLAVILAGSLPAIRLLLTLRPAEVLHGR